MSRSHRITALLGATVLVPACSSGPSPIDGQAIADQIDDTIDDADFDDDFATVDCPVDDWDDIVEDALADVDEDVVGLALAGERDEAAYLDPTGESIDCSFFAPDADAGAGLFMLETPRDVDEYTEEFATGGQGGARVDIDPTNEYRGGQFRHVCVAYDDDQSGYCQVEWVDDDVLLGLYVFGAGVDRIDLDDVEAAFTPQLDVIADQFTG